MILLLGNYAPDGQQSMSRFCGVLENEFAKRGLRVETIRPERVMGRICAGPRGLGKLMGYVDKFLFFRSKLRRRLGQFEKGDLLHICDHSNAIYTADARNVPHVVTCHDAMAIRGALGELPEHRVRASGRVYQRWILRGLQRARRITCVSEFTRGELLRVSGLAAERVSVTHNGLNYRYRPMPVERSERRYILHVGGNQWYKNRVGVVRIYRELSKRMERAPDLFLVGERWDQALRAEVNASGFPAKIREIENCSNAELNAYYAGAELLLFPSLMEGFGWPVIEAQASGCPVVASDIAALREVGGEAAIFVEAGNYGAAAGRIAEFLQGGGREARVRKGFENAARFSTERMVEGYFNVYSEAVSNFA